MSTTTIINEPKQVNKPQNKQKQIARPKKTYIEVMRIIAAFFVIVNHTNSDVFLKYSEGGSFTWFFSLTYFFVSKVAVPVFLMIMGGLLLQKIDSPKKSIDRVVRMVTVVIIFSLVYYLYLHRAAPETMSISDFLNRIFSKRTNNAFWYIYTYIGLLILLPIFQRIAHAFSKKAMEYLIFISLIVMGTLPLLEIFFQIKLSHYVTDMFFVPTIGIVFTGFYIERYMKITKSTFAYACFFFVAIIACEVMLSYLKFQESPQSYLQLDNWQYINITASSFCFYIIFKYLSNSFNKHEAISKTLCYLGSLTFGVYLLSDLMMFITRPYYQEGIVDTEHIILITVLWEIIIFVSCGIITAILKFVPGLKKLI